MAFVQYRPSSPYFRTKQTSWYLDQMEPRQIPPDDSDELIVVGSKHEYRPDMLSYDLYGTPDYWWIFMVRNMNLIRDPIFDLKAGMHIMVPTRNRLSRLFT